MDIEPEYLARLSFRGPSGFYEWPELVKARHTTQPHSSLVLVGLSPEIAADAQARVQKIYQRTYGLGDFVTLRLDCIPLMIGIKKDDDLRQRMLNHTQELPPVRVLRECYLTEWIVLPGDQLHTLELNFALNDRTYFRATSYLLTPQVAASAASSQK